MSADGKIADTHRAAARFSSARDLHHLEARVADADAVLFGGGTLRTYGTTLPVRQPELVRQRRQQGRAEQPLQIVFSPSGQLSPTLRFFQQPVPRCLLTTPQGAEHWRQQPGFHHIWTMEPQANGWNWRQGLAPLADLGIRRIALLGGGQLVAALVAQNWVQEMYLTVCPLLLGGQQAPTPVDGAGFPAALAPRLQLLSSQVIEQEVYLHYRVQPVTLQAEGNSITLEQNAHHNLA